MTTPNVLRAHGRRIDELRSIQITYDLYGYATASVLLELGNTKVLCAVSLQHGVPLFLKGKRSGWLTAEYAMLPSATHIRTQRESVAQQRNGRNVEISRLIGRCLRSIVNLELLGEYTIVVDCDVLQADGGTRTVAITGACLALTVAVSRWIAAGKITTSPLTDTIAAISVGVVKDQLLLDIDFAEDSSIDADFNVVLTKSGAVVEIQGTAEKRPLSWHTFEQIHMLAHHGMAPLFALYDHPKTDAALQLAFKKEDAHTISTTI